MSTLAINPTADASFTEVSASTLEFEGVRYWREKASAKPAIMGGVDVIVFTGGIGENSAEVRHTAASRLDFLGARLDEDRNRGAKVGPGAPVSSAQEGDAVALEGWAGGL